MNEERHYGDSANVDDENVVVDARSLILKMLLMIEEEKSRPRKILRKTP